MANKAARKKSASQAVDRQPVDAGRPSGDVAVGRPAASRARAGRVAATRPVTAAAQVRPPSSSSRARSRAWPGECDWVAMREIVPAATAALQLTGELARARGDAGHRAADGLAGAGAPGRRRCSSACRWPAGPATPAAMSRTRWSGRSTPSPGLRSRSPRCPRPGAGCRTCSTRRRALDVEVHPGFDFWLEGVEDRSAEVVASMERANEAVVPTTRLTSVEAAYWCEIRDRNHLRWVMPHDEEALLDALATAARRSAPIVVGKDSRYVGAFRADGLVVPVWDLEPGTVADSLEDPVIVFAGRLAEAMADGTPLDDAQRRARAGLRSRQLTLR